MSFGMEYIKVKKLIDKINTLILLDIRADAWRVLFRYRPLKNFSNEMLENKRAEYKDNREGISECPELNIGAPYE